MNPARPISAAEPGVGTTMLNVLVVAATSNALSVNWNLVLAGCIASAGLALATDALLGVIERYLPEKLSRPQGFLP